jgi:hypothetical protein
MKMLHLDSSGKMGWYLMGYWMCFVSQSQEIIIIIILFFIIGIFRYPINFILFSVVIPCFEKFTPARRIE